jgi:hypothetical protein
MKTSEFKNKIGFFYYNTLEECYKKAQLFGAIFAADKGIPTKIEKIIHGSGQQLGYQLCTDFQNKNKLEKIILECLLEKIEGRFLYQGNKNKNYSPFEDPPEYHESFA